ncbi:glycoside hydrolase superfamily [Lipomyces kononenkoae]|uniref:Glycoside hydrolase superfamily n=1 Tax=Lipomyces kononenkoae TaxID=34357 RepID=A0ACC3T1E1_LIPKO
MAPSGREHKWWKEGVVYQIYPASFKDSNDDGIGDIPGIISQLDYLQDLGIDIVWVSPHYKSPQVDMGYDISDYQDIHEPYGTLEDCEELIKAVHDRGMRIIFDLVINHTSDQHAWFQESRSSKNSPKRDWYIWRPAKYDENGKRLPPNNWRSNFSKPAWTWDAQTQEYYLHVFAPEQPDLNWDNEECRKAIYETSMRFWLEKGVDGFRIDTVNMYSKVPTLPDAPIKDPTAESQLAQVHYCNGPRMHEFLSEMHQVLEPYDTMTVGECAFTFDSNIVMEYISAAKKQLDMVFHFDVVDLGQTPGSRYEHRPYTIKDFKYELLKWQSLIEGTDAWTTVFLENHDQGRSISRFASDLPEFRESSAKLLSVVLATLTGTIFIYQGQEIGMINIPATWPIEDYKDIKAISHYNRIKQRTNGNPEALAEAMRSLQIVGRDHSRVPMQWEGTSKNAGFCSDAATPWMRVLESHEEINVENQLGRKDSVLEFWKKMIKTRKNYKDLFVYGTFKQLEENNIDDKVLVFGKEDSQGQRSLTVANISTEEKSWTLPDWARGYKLLIQSTEDVHDGHLLPFEARVYIGRGVANGYHI